MVEQQFFFIYILMAVEIWDLNTAERCARLPAVSSNGSVNDSARSRVDAMSARHVLGVSSDVPTMKLLLLEHCFQDPPPSPLFDGGELAKWSFYRAAIA
ncbi:putative aquaporin PIP2-8 [Bienertia sinuspersici]